MRKLCPNFDKEDGLDTVLEVPLPEDMGQNASLRWQNMRTWMQAAQKIGSVPGQNNDQFMLLLKLVGSPLIPFRAQTDHTQIVSIRGGSLEASTAKYIVQQYLAATGGHVALDAVTNMYAIGQVKMISSDIHQTDAEDPNSRRSGEVGGFVLWQKNPDLWFLELVVSGCKVSAGSDGKVAWSQSSSHPTNVTKGPPKPLRRFFQGLDPRSTANLFINAVCAGEKTINNEECFQLKLETSKDILNICSTPNTEVVHHTIWGYFSQRTGLLIKLEDSKLVKMKPSKGNEIVLWETIMESLIQDYRYVEGINIAHSGKTTITMHRYGKKLQHKSQVEETWMIDEIDFNICGLSLDCFLPPADERKEQENEEHAVS